MASKASELYVLFQNKAHHYQNLQTAKSKVQNRLSQSLNNTINVIEKQKYDRDFPKQKRYYVETENKGLSQRIVSISHNDRIQVKMDGSYSRFNRFQRQFRTKNHYKNEEQRQIELQNQRIKSKIDRMKSGSTKFWSSEFKEQQKFVKKVANAEDRTSRCSLMIQKKPFLAEPYLDLINHLQKDKKRGLDESIASQKSNKPDLVKFQQQKLFILPQLNSRQVKLKRSKASLSALSSSEPIIPQAPAQSPSNNVPTAENLQQTSHKEPSSKLEPAP